MVMTWATLMVCAQLVQDPAPAAPAAQKPSPVEAPAVAAINGFGLDLYKVLAAREPKENLFFSPLSLTTALTMVAEGARGETAAEMTKVLHLPTPLLPAHEGLAALDKRLRVECGGMAAETRKKVEAKQAEIRDIVEKRTLSNWEESSRRAVELKTEVEQMQSEVVSHELQNANALWLDASLQLRPEFLAFFDRYHDHAEVLRLDLAGDPEGSRSRINSWMATQTQQRVRAMLPPGAVTQATRLVLASAVRFRGHWEYPFPPARTAEAEFLLGDAGPVRVMMMNHPSHQGLRYAAYDGKGNAFQTPEFEPEDPIQTAACYPGADGFTMAEIPYRGHGLAVVVLLPRSPTGLARLEGLLEPGSLAKWVDGLKGREVTLGLPRIGSTTRGDLSGALQQLGMRRAFSGTAQFEGMVGDGQPLRLESCLQETGLSIDEEGAGFSSGSCCSEMIGIVSRKPFVPVFRADRPFLFLIRDTASGAILFVGRIVDPRS